MCALDCWRHYPNRLRWDGGDPANVAGMWYLDLIVSGNVEGIPS